MLKSIKLKNGNYLDSSSIVHNKKFLKEILNNINSSCFCIIKASSFKEETQATFVTKEVNGNAFLIVENGIKIQNASRVRISANLNVQFQESGKSFLKIIIKKNEEIVMRNYAYTNNMELYYYDCCDFHGFELDVNNNDIITMYISSDLSGVIHNDEWGKSYIAIEKIK